VARGEAGPPRSDVEVGILFATDPPATLEAPQFAIEAALERLLGAPVQVVPLNRASADLVHRVLRVYRRRPKPSPDVAGLSGSAGRAGGGRR